MEVKVGVKVDITPTAFFTILPFKAIVLHEVLNFLFYFLLLLPFIYPYLILIVPCVWVAGVVVEVPVV